MDWGLIVGIASIGVTVLIALITHFVKKRNYPGRMVVSLVNHHLVMGEKPFHYPDLSLNYGAYQIEKKLQYVQILFFNERAHEIKADNARAHVDVKLPAGVEWADIRVLKETEGVGASAEVEDTDLATAKICFDMLRRGDCIWVEGLIETDNNYYSEWLFKKMSFFHRIPELDSIVKVDYLKASHDTGSLWKHIVVFLVFVMTLLPAIFFSTDNLPLRFIDVGNGNSSYLFINDKSEIIASPTLLEKNIGYKVDASSFSDKMVPDTTYYRNSRRVFVTRMAALLSMIAIFIYLLIYSCQYLRFKRVLKYLVMLMDDSSSSKQITSNHSQET